MKTLLTRVKSAIVNDSTLASYIKGVEITAPNIIPDLASSKVPWIGIAPVDSPEAWKSNVKREVTHLVDIYIVSWLQIQETAIMGDSAGNRGLIDIIVNVDTTLRGHTFSDYLSQPTQITGVSYRTAGYGDNIYLIVATIRLQCNRIF